MTTPPWLAGLQDQDPSVPLCLAALARVADENGHASFGELILEYRNTFLRCSREVGLPVSLELSGDQVRENLRRSVLPRLVTQGYVRVSPVGGDLPEAVEAAGAWWSDIRVDREGLRERMLDTACDALRHSMADQAGAVRPTGSILEGAGLSKSFKRRKVVDDVTVRVEQGEIVGLLGPNGAGKTTTFYLITGLIRPDRGRVRIDDQDLTHAPMYRRARAGIGYLAQEPSVFRKLSVEDNIRAILETVPLSREQRQARLERMLDELGIKHLRRNKAYSLSGGERRRLEITRALVTDPKFMLLDEPFAGVDPIAVHDIQTIVAGLRHRGLGVLITDHNVEQTLDIVDRAYIMFEGQVQVSGTVRELVFDDRVAELYLGPTLTSRLRGRLEVVA